MFTTKKLENIKKLNCYLSQRADILQGIYLLNENILKKRLLKGERIILGVKVDNSFKIIEDTLNPFQFAYEFIGIAYHNVFFKPFVKSCLYFTFKAIY